MFLAMKTVWNGLKWRQKNGVLLEKCQWNATSADALNAYIQTSICYPRAENSHCNFLNILKIYTRSLAVS